MFTLYICSHVFSGYFCLLNNIDNFLLLVQLVIDFSLYGLC